MEATNLLGGTVVDICDEDWSPGVTDATHSIEPIENVILTHKAETDSIRVFINGSLNYDWYYVESILLQSKDESFSQHYHGPQ